MEAWQWVAIHWLDLLQSVGIVGGLLFTMHTIHMDAKSRKIANLIAFTRHHHDIWKEMYERPELARVLHAQASLERRPITADERLFARLLIIHLHTVHRTMKEDVFVNLKGLQKDMRMSFASPILRAVWNEMKEFQDEDFVEFVESTIQ